jgi:superfamily II DNA or RNA helicase
MKLDVFNSHMELYPYAKDDYRVIEDMYTSIDKFSQKEVPCGYLIEDGKLYLPRGTSVSKIEQIVGVEANYVQESDPISKMSRQFKSLYDPRNQLQEDSIKFLTKEGGHQLGLNLQTGFGKTFCVAYASTELNEKAIIITPNEGLKGQWINTYHKMFNYRPKNLMNIAGSNIIAAIMEDMVDPADVYFVNHATLRNYMTALNGYALHKFFKKIEVGIKVYDESHMEFGNILLIDNFSNTNRTWYLTATFDRSDKTESVCFKRAFSTVITFGELESQEIMVKHVVYHVVNINSRPTPKDRGKVMGYPGFSAASYGRYAFISDDNQTAYNAILNILGKIKGLEGKTIIFVPLIEAVDLVVKKLKLDHPEKSVAAYHSKTSKDEKESAVKKDIIVTTIRSCGTGRDIPGLRSIICLDPVASKVIAQQMIGRLRPYAKDKMTYFFDIVDVAFAPLNWWFRSRFKKIQTLVKEVIYLNLDK